MNYKLGRNEKCQCGSGKKYKKCCLHKKTPNDVIEYLYNDLTFKDRINLKPSNDESLQYVIDHSKIPDEIESSVMSYISTYPIIELGCWFNSSQLSLLDERINVEHGFHGYKIEEDIKKLGKKLKSSPLKLNKDGFYEVKIMNEIHFIDLKKGLTFTPHSWNSFNGVHFDLTKQFDEFYKNKWVYYLNNKSFTTESYSDIQKGELFKRIQTVKLMGKIMNQCQLV